MCLLDYLWPGGDDNNTVAAFKYQTLKMALMHDFDEAILRRDITHELKYNAYNGSELRNVLDEFVAHQVADEFGDDSVVSKTLSKDAPYYDVAHAIVKVADWMALLYFLKRELAMGNRSWPLNLLPYCKESYHKAVSTLQSTCVSADICEQERLMYVWVGAINDLQNDII